MERSAAKHTKAGRLSCTLCRQVIVERDSLMREIALMNPSKETDNKLRWRADVVGVSFSLYIPKWRVPAPWPERLKVVVDQQAVSPATAPSPPRSGSPELERPIIAILEKVREHTKTVRYRPVGDSDSWEIGEPYVPYTVMPTPPPERLRLEVRWDRSAGTWSDE